MPQGICSSDFSLMRGRGRDRQTGRQTDRQTETDRQTDTEAERKRERNLPSDIRLIHSSHAFKTERQTDRQTQTDRDKQQIVINLLLMNLLLFLPLRL